MNTVRCPACGAPLAGDSVICVNCGKLVRRRTPKPPVQQRPQRRTAGPAAKVSAQPQRRPAQKRPYVQTTPSQAAPKRKNDRVRNTRPAVNADANSQRRAAAPRSVQRPVYDAPPPEIQAQEAGGNFKRNKGVKGKLRLAARGCCAALLIAVIYMGGFLIQTTRVRLSSYHFKSNMKMTYSSYGKAIDNYFEGGHWSANLFTGKCTYTGTTKHGEEYELVFRAGATVKLTGINIDGEAVEKDMIESKVMGMFI